jgi:ribonuclease D
MSTPHAHSDSISRESLQLLPLYSFEGPVHLVDDERKLHSALKALKREALLGFDTETKPVFVKGVSHPPALVQLAGEREAYVFQLNRLGGLDGLTEILGDPGILKAGVALRDDLRKLRAHTPFEPAGFVEIADLCKPAGIRQTGLRPLAGLLLGVRISKREQRSNWARSTLTRSQITYAATDAWISREIYRKLLTLPARPHAQQAAHRGTHDAAPGGEPTTHRES